MNNKEVSKVSILVKEEAMSWQMEGDGFMKYKKLREELIDFYWNKVNLMAKDFCEKCTQVLEESYDDGMTSYQAKALQYLTIADMCQPVLFQNIPFYYELGTMANICDGAGEFRDGHVHAGGWLYRKNKHMFIDQDPEAYERLCAHKSELLYLIGPYCDPRQHFIFYCRPVYKHGLKGIYDRVQELLDKATNVEEKDFLNGVCAGLLAMKKIAEKFSAVAEEKWERAESEEERKHWKLIQDTAKRVPWNRPETFYEALNCCAFFRTVVGSLEGVGPNTFGRVDVDLYPFYEKDLTENRITKEEAYELIAKFLIVWDCHYDHDMKMEFYADHELENTYVLGGCDAEGRPVYNDLTEMFLRATSEEKIIYPKIKCRFSADSPREYLDEINRSIIAGTSTVLYQNDECCIPTLVKAGRPLEEARDYIVSGCWDMKTNGKEKPDGGAYVNLLKAFEFSIHNRIDKMERVGIAFQPIDDAKSFEEVYQITLKNIRILFEERTALTSKYGRIWSKVDPLMLISSTLENCLENKKDYTAGGAKYNDEVFLCFGLPNIVDSLIVINKLCFEEKRYTLGELLETVRNNWAGKEDMRQEALACPCWGDGSKEASLLARRFNDDVYAALEELPTRWPGKIHFGHLTYTEIKWWGEKTLATPDGRYSGSYISQGLTPSRLHEIKSVTAPINSMRILDVEKCAGNSVINIFLSPKGMTLDKAYSFLMAVARSGIQSLQLNCASKETLLDAQKHPENYPDLIVRVCGFSAKFTSLSPAWQDEVITRNFYD